MKHLVLTLFVASQVWAGTPLWTFTPLTSTKVSISPNGSASVQYAITNQSTKTHTLQMREITGVTQVTTGTGVCPSPFALAGHASCVLSLNIDGSQVQAGSTNGPILCEQGGLLQCYRPSASGVLTVSVAQAQSYTVGGAISGLSGIVGLQINGTQTTSFSIDGAFTFGSPLSSGASYEVTVVTQPDMQTCVVSNGSGVIQGANITNVIITCSENAYTIGGTISGLTMGTIVLQNNGSDNNSVTTNGSFTFSTPVAEGAPYNVTVATQPVCQLCTVTNGSGTVGGANVTNVGVNCVSHMTQGC